MIKNELTDTGNVSKSQKHAERKNPDIFKNAYCVITFT